MKFKPTQKRSEKKMARKLIVNADGYGFTPGVNEGILKAFEAGLVKSTSCTPNFGFLNEAGRVQKAYPDVSFGIHFNLNVGHPLSPVDQVRSLVGDDERFLGSDFTKRILRGKVKQKEVEKELTAQCAILADQGIQISHWDGHQNKHLWPLYFETAAKVAAKFGIKGIRSHRRSLYSNEGPVTPLSGAYYYLKNPKRVVTHLGGRIRTLQAERKGFWAADRLITPGYFDESHKSLKEFWLILASSLKSGTSEVYCHPGFPDDILRANAAYVDQRASEVAVLTSEEVIDAFAQNGVEVINFHEASKVGE